jgi:hypothetical protein
VQVEKPEILMKFQQASMNSFQNLYANNRYCSLHGYRARSRTAAIIVVVVRVTNGTRVVSAQVPGAGHVALR